MTAILFKFDTPLDVSPPFLDGVKIRFSFTFINSEYIDTPKQNSETKQGKVSVQASRSLLDTWSLEGEPLQRVLFQIAKEHIRSTLGHSGTLPSDILLKADTNTYPGACPFNPALIKEPAGTVIQIEI
jgi:hypothetical protein